MGCLAGFYECKNDGVLLQTGMLTVEPRPQLTLTPIRRNVGCQAGLVSVVQLECCVQRPYQVQLKNQSLTAQVVTQPGTAARGYISLAYGTRLQ